MKSVSESGTLYGDYPRKHQNPYVKFQRQPSCKSKIGMEMTSYFTNCLTLYSQNSNHRDDSKFTAQGKCSKNGRAKRESALARFSTRIKVPSSRLVRHGQVGTLPITITIQSGWRLGRIKLQLGVTVTTERYSYELHSSSVTVTKSPT